MSIRITLAGIGPGAISGMTAAVQEAIRKSDCLLGAGRMIDCALLLPDTQPSLVCREYRADRLVGFIKEHASSCGSFCILLSGDTGFFSGSRALAQRLQDDLPNARIDIQPGLSSVVYMAAKMGVPWQDAALLSLHGESPNYIHAISCSRRVFMLLGRKGTEEEIVEKLSDYGMGEITVTVGHHLSMEQERIIRKKAADLRPSDLEGLCVACFENERPRLAVAPQLGDDLFIRGAAPMTKEEVRTLSVAKLGLTKGSVLYDVGAGTGSVGIQAALLDGSIRVYAIEKKEAALELIHRNRQKFRTDFLTVVAGEAPGCMEELPACTHAFIGGSSGNLQEILRLIRRKNPQATIVINAISLETLGEAMSAAREGLLPEADIIQVSAARARKLAGYHMMTGENPIYIITSRVRQKWPQEEDMSGSNTR